MRRPPAAAALLLLTGIAPGHLHEVPRRLEALTQLPPWGWLGMGLVTVQALLSAVRFIRRPIGFPIECHRR